MGPAATMNDVLTSGMHLAITCLADDGSNWIDYKNKILITMGAQGLKAPITGTAKQPAPFALVSGKPVLADGTTLASEADIEAKNCQIKEFDLRDDQVKNIIINTILLTLAQSIGLSPTAKVMWDTVLMNQQGKTLLYQVDAHQRLQLMKCTEGQDVAAHLAEMT
jgi:gag-polypeptide of LTR copia-type